MRSSVEAIQAGYEDTQRRAMAQRDAEMARMRDIAATRRCRVPATALTCQLRFLLTGDFQSMLETLRGQLDIPTGTTTSPLRWRLQLRYCEEIESGCPASTRGPTASIKATWERRWMPREYHRQRPVGYAKHDILLRRSVPGLAERRLQSANVVPARLRRPDSCS